MIAVTQLVDHASVSLYDQPESLREITHGLVVFLGVAKTDTDADVDKLVSKLIKLRIFPDSGKKMNLDIQTANGQILLISQFTLLGNLRGGNRPDFFEAADKDLAVRLYEQFADKLTKADLPVKTGFFGDHMKITANLDGPVTIILNSHQL
jgi:D-tyrosyl-tRNA(Tyr) deacylase